ncbi:MspA family porin [Nocardia sp. 348MFTsu5.1]|uniref:MspA family porin n=1 Tax=Nocardia sp. 348MFTsu5.1 TaxID=1172185 RepID=UPI000377E6C5|nr:MspA family porin [Nocardia sp. 348MFTsu5.1]
MKNTTSRRLAAAAGLAGVSAVALAAMGTGAAAAGALPGGTTTQTLDDGTKVTVRLFDESSTITPSMAATPASRNVWLDGKIAVNIDGGAKGGKIESGYVVGCQLNFGATAGASGGATVNPAADPPIAVIPSGTGVPTSTGGFTLGPGQATTVAFFSDDKGKNAGFEFKGATGGLAYNQETFAVYGCAGFAEAKAYVKVTVKTKSTTGIVTLWGAPFSIG